MAARIDNRFAEANPADAAVGVGELIGAVPGASGLRDDMMDMCRTRELRTMHDPYVPPARASVTWPSLEQCDLDPAQPDTRIEPCEAVRSNVR